MRNPFQPGDIQEYRTVVTTDKLASFDTGLVHPVYSTFALGHDVEWACRLFVLEMKEPGEEGVGSYLSVEHVYPAPLGSMVLIRATLESVQKNEVVCTWEAFANGHTIARGRQIQRVVNHDRFRTLYSSIEMKDHEG